MIFENLIKYISKKVHSLCVCFHQFLCFISHPFQPMTPHTIYTSLTYILFLPNADKQDCKKHFNISLFQKAYDKKANVKAISIKRAPWNLGYRPMTVITCSLDFPEFQTWLHNDRGGVLPVAITGQVQPPGDLDQSRSDRHNTTALESGEKQIHLWSATLPPPPDGRRAEREQEVKPLYQHLNPPPHSSSFRPFNFFCGYCPHPYLSQPALKYLCLSIVKEVK